MSAVQVTLELRRCYISFNRKFTGFTWSKMRRNIVSNVSNPTSLNYPHLCEPPWHLYQLVSLGKWLLLMSWRYLCLTGTFGLFYEMGRCHPHAWSNCTTHCVWACEIVFNNGSPRVVHSDQGHNFESTLLKNTLEVFGASKSHTNVYHPQGDGMVEGFNRTLLQMLRSYVYMGKTPPTSTLYLLHISALFDWCISFSVNVW